MPPPFVQELFRRARHNPRHVVLPEGEDDRIIAAAQWAVREGLAKITLLGTPEIITPRIRDSDMPASWIEVVDPTRSLRLEDYAERFFELRKHEGISREKARKAVLQPLLFAAMMVHRDAADGTIGGAVNTTADTLKAALQVVGRKQHVKTVSSFFIMLPHQRVQPIQSPVIFADCAMVVAPDAEQLAEIGLSTGESAHAILNQDPRIGFLSFSTSGSSKHRNVDTVTQALDMARKVRPNWFIPRELQFDAAVDEKLRQKKVPDLAFKGHPNVFIFPNLEAGNIGYKIAERIGGMTAIGPVLQGLAKPANDLSRGCKVEDIVALIALTCIQAQNMTRNG